jgi:TldD protein
MKLRGWLALAALALTCSLAAAQDASNSSASDPVVQAMKTELDRSMKQLRLEQALPPYYIEYSVTDLDQFSASASFGALRSRVRIRGRAVRAVVRVGDYKQDSYEGAGEGHMDLLPVDNDLLALRQQLWLATDLAYKQALEALTAKQARLKQLEVETPTDDFARAPAVEMLAPLVHLEVDEDGWSKTLETTSALYREMPDVQSFESSLHFAATNRYLVNSEGTVVRHGSTSYVVNLTATAQAPDGMHLSRGHTVSTPRQQELPSADELRAAARKALGELQALRAAPLVEDEYRGPVLFAAEASDAVFLRLVAPNILGRKPAPGSPARTVGEYSGSYKSRVLPDFISVIDDPSATTAQGRSLMGAYAVDDEGVREQTVTAVDKGELVAYLLGRQPIRDFPASNGHGRAGVSPAPAPAISNLFLRSSQTVSAAELKKKLVDLCAQRSLPYCYRAEDTGQELAPGLLYKVWAKDGHEELVRGAVFGELDTRALRNEIVAMGDDYKTFNVAGGTPESIVAPSVLFEELQVKRSTANKQKLPVYGPPPEGGK